MEYPVPKRVQANFKVKEKEKNSEFLVKGRIKCTCGCETFSVFTFGKKGLFSGKVEKANFEGEKRAAVFAACKLCGKKITVYDSGVDGIDSFLKGSAPVIPTPDFRGFKCGKCKENNLSMDATYHSKGRGLKMDGVGESNWNDAFTGYVLSGVCNTCGKKAGHIIEEIEPEK